MIRLIMLLWTSSICPSGVVVVVVVFAVVGVAAVDEMST